MDGGNGLPKSIRHQFSKQNKQYLLEFLKISLDNKTSSSCDLKEYSQLKTSLPLDNELKHDLKEFLKKPDEVIDLSITELDEEVTDLAKDKELSMSINISTHNTNRTAGGDITYAIKECLESHKVLDDTVINDLQSTDVDVEEVFKDLSTNLCYEEIVNLGSSIVSSSFPNETVIVNYIRHLLLKELNSKFSEELLELTKKFSLKHFDHLKEELSVYLINSETNLKVCLQFLENLNNDFKSKTLRTIVFGCSDLKVHLISCIEVLLNPLVDYDTINKLVELMSNSANNYNQDKNFGKLFTIVIKFIGKNMVQLEQLLRHIVNVHRSVWKSNMQKILDSSLQDSFMLSQSFRY